MRKPKPYEIQRCSGSGPGELCRALVVRCGCLSRSWHLDDRGRGCAALRHQHQRFQRVRSGRVCGRLDQGEFAASLLILPHPTTPTVNWRCMHRKAWTMYSMYIVEEHEHQIRQAESEKPRANFSGPLCVLLLSCSVPSKHKNKHP